jgi:hypothetical protein
MAKTHLGVQFTHHLILEMLSMINYNSLWDTESSDDVVKHEECYNATIIKECRHSLNPFSEVINDNDDITVPLN